MLRWSMVAALMAGAVALRALLNPWLGPSQPFLFAYLAVLAATLIAGWRAAAVGGAAALVVSKLVFADAGPGVRTPGARDVVHLGSAGIVAGAIIALTDLSQRMRLSAAAARSIAGQAASEARQLEALHRATFEQAAVGMIHVAESGRILAANQRACVMLGYTPDELTGMTLLEITHPDDRRATEASFRALVAGRTTSVHAEKRYLRKDGTMLWGSVSVSIHRDGATGRIASVLGVIEDIGARKEAEERLLRSNQRLSLLAHASQDLLRAEDPREFLDGLSRRLAERLGLEVYIHYLMNPDGRSMRLAAYGGIDEVALASKRECALGEGVCGAAAEARSPVVIDDVQNTSGERTAFLRRLGLTAYASHPLIARGRLIGTLSFGTRRGGRMDPDSLALLRAVSDQAAAVIERKRSDDALRESEERYRMLVEQVMDFAIFRVDPAGVATSWNEGVRRVLGFDEEEFLGCDSRMLFTPEDQAAGVPEQELRAAASEGSASHDRWMRRKDGTRFWAMGTTTALRDAEGAVIGFTKVMRDQTGLWRAQEGLRLAKERLDAALEAADLGTWRVEVRTGTVWRDAGMNRLLGLEGVDSHADLESYYERIHPDDRAAARAALERALREGGAYESEHRVLLPGGRIRWLRDRGRAVPGDGVWPAVMTGAAADITARKLAEEELARHRDRLQEILRERTAALEDSHQKLRISERLAGLGTLAAGLGHDMGNLLLPLRARLESIEAQVKSEGVRDDVAAIRKAAEYLQRLTHGLRLLALDPDDPQASSAGTDLHDWWPDAEPLLRNALPRTFQLEHRFPPGPLAVALARPGLTQAVFNLVQNAGQAMQGGRGSRVTIWAERAQAPGRAEGVVRFGVTDDGPGMTPDVARRCLDPFFTTRARTHATGMGLALVHATVQKVGGSIEVHSDPGRGTTFVLVLPAVARGEGPPRARRAARVQLADPRLRSFVHSLLRAMDFEVDNGSSSPGGDGVCLWVADSSGATGDAAEQFLAAGASRCIVVLGDPPPGAPAGRVTALGPNPKPAAIRQALHDAARICDPAFKYRRADAPI